MERGRPTKYTQKIADQICASIYCLKCPLSGDVRYIGKANNPAQRFKSHMAASRKKDSALYRWIRSCGQPVMEILIHESVDWVADEIRLIADYRARGYDLINVAKGGNEPPCTYEVRAANGRNNARARTSTPERARVYSLKRSLSRALQQGLLCEASKSKLRLCAEKDPSRFSEWSNI